MKEMRHDMKVAESKNIHEENIKNYKRSNNELFKYKDKLQTEEE